MSFLDVQIVCKDKTFATSVNRKPAFSEVNTHFDSFLPSTCKSGTAYILAYKCFRIFSLWTKLYTELLFLKQIFLENGYIENFINA